MNPLCHYREFAIQRLSLQHKVERQSQTYLEVFAHKATDPLLKQTILNAYAETKDRVNSIDSLLLSMNEIAQPGYPEATNGIMYEGLQRLGAESDPFTRDGIILQTLILLYEYKLGSYRIVAHYFRALEQEFALYVIQNLLKNERRILQQFSKLLTAEGTDSSSKKHSQKEPARPRSSKQAVAGIMNNNG